MLFSNDCCLPNTLTQVSIPTVVYDTEVETCQQTPSKNVFVGEEHLNLVITICQQGISYLKLEMQCIGRDRNHT